MKRTVIGFVFTVLAVILFQCQSTKNVQTLTDKDPESGLFLDKNLILIKGQCTACHSAKLISMNRFTREGWQEKIRWMQQTQNLWDLGEAEPLVLDYLEKHYSPEPQASRRANLENVEWYELRD